MYGRLVEVEGVDPSKREEVLGIIRQRVIPGLKEMDGFAGFIVGRAGVFDAIQPA